jgi:prepilin-type N-terminal cleavage/methylation domain-containing protein
MISRENNREVTQTWKSALGPLTKRMECGELAPAFAHEQVRGRAARIPYPSSGVAERESAGAPALPRFHASTLLRFYALQAFTLIEMLVVIAIIAVLSALIAGLLPRAKEAQVRKRVAAELVQLETAIETYKAKRGFYPPDNPSNPGSNSLYYELSGTSFNDGNKTYTTLSGDGPLPAASVSTAFGAAGFVNSNATADDAKNCHPVLKAATQVRELDVNGVKVKLLGMAIRGPAGDFCPWYYNSSTPTNNQNSYDIWVEVLVSGKPKTFGNWKE